MAHIRPTRPMTRHDPWRGVFDSVLLYDTDPVVIREAIEQGARITPETLNRALFWENPAGVKELLDHGAPIAADIGFCIDYYTYKDMFGDRDDVLRQFLSHPRINPADFEHFTPDCRRIAEELSRERVIRRTRCIKKELIAATWAPERHVAWCLEVDYFASSNIEF